MSFDDSVLNDLGIKDNSGEKDDGFEKFLSKPIQRQYQPFGGPVQTPQSSIAEPQYAPHFDQQQQPQQYQYQGGFGDELDYYDQIKKQHSYISRDASAHNSSAKLYEDRYDDFVKTKFKPFYKQFDEFGDFENDDDYFNSLDSLYQNDLKASKEEDGFFGGESDNKRLAKERLGKYIGWNQPNGLRDQFLRLKQEKANRRAMADQMDAQKNALMEQMTNIPIPARMAMDEQLKSRSSRSKPSAKKMNEMLSGMDFEQPVVDMVSGEVTNLERTDPRKSVPSAVNMVTGERTKSYGAQQQRQAAAMTGDIQGVLAKRDLTAKERKLRNKGVMFSQNGLMDGYPVGMSRQDVDLLDLAEMKKAGMKSYQGRPLEEVLNELGGEERLQMAQVMRGVYAAKSNYEDAQLQYLKAAGGSKSEALKAKMEEARESVNKTIGLASQFGLDNELFEQAETTGWFAALGNAIERGMLMSEMSNYTPDFITNTLDQDEMQKFIEVASEIEDLPTSSAVARYKKVKSDGFLDALGNLVFDNPMAIPEMFLESMASFLPATFKWGAATAGIGAAAGAFKGSAAGAPGIVGGALAGGSLGARAGWGVASFTLETSGTVLEGMQELGIDWKNPKIFAAAWNNETTRNAIVKKAVKKGIPIALMDTLSAGMAGKVGGLKQLGLNGGKLIDGASWAQNLKYASAAAPRFTKWQKVSNVGTELGADSALGMAGEYFGQAWSKEPGEAFDYDAIAAEGIIGVGPGIAGGFMEQMRGASNEFTNAPIQYSSQQTTPDGTTGTINRAGFKTPYRTFNSADGMTTGILNMAGIDSSNMADPENATKVMAVQDWIANMWISNPESMTNLRVIVADRTPFADMDNEGSFERDEDGNGVIYMNRKKFNEDPIGAFMHEAGHLARHTMFTNEELLNVYNGLTPDDKLSAFAEYYKRVPNQAFNQYSEREQAEIKKAYNKFQKSKGDIGLADEWFSFQFVRYLAGGTVDPSLKSDMQGWLQKYAYPFLEKFAGSEKLGGSKKDILAARVLSYMGRTPRGFAGAVNPNLQAPDMPGTETDFSSPGIRAPKGANVLDGLSDSEGLNHLVSRIMEEFATPQERAQFAKDYNTFVEKNVLPTKPSFYTQAEMETAVGAQVENKFNNVAASGTVGGKLAQEIRKLEELLARGRVEKIKEADFAEPDVTEFKPETDPEKIRNSEKSRADKARSNNEYVKDATAEVRRINEEIKKNESDIQALDDEFQDVSGSDLEEGSDFLNYYDKKKMELDKKSRELELELLDAQLARDLFREKDNMDFKTPDSVINYRSKLINLSKGGKNPNFIMSPDDSTEMSDFLKRYLEEAKKRTSDPNAPSPKKPKEDQGKGPGFVGRSPRNIAREKEQYKVLGKRYRATLTMPGYRGEESRVEYYATKEEADKAVADFLEQQNNKRIKRIQSKHKKAFDILKDDAKFKKAYDEATKKLGDESSIHARIAEALGLSGLMSESLFGAAYSARHLGEDKVHGGGVKGAVKAPSMREVQNDLFMSDAEQENALELLQNRETELVKEIERLKGLLPEAEAEAETAPAKEPKEKAVYSKVKVVQLRPVKGKKGKFTLWSMGKGGKLSQVKNEKDTAKLLNYLRKLDDTDQIDPQALKKVKGYKDGFVKAADKYSGQLRYWLVSKKGESSKPKKSKKAKKKEQPDRDIFTQDRGLVKISEEIKDAERALKFVRQYKDVIAPEAKSFMWADLPHPSYYVDKKGTQRLTLGVLAKKSGKLAIYEKDRNGKLKYKSLSNPQQTLLAFTVGDSKYDGSKRKDFDFLKGTGLSKEDYALHVESIPAAILNPKDGMLKPLGNMSIDSKGNQRVEDYFGGFQADKGTNYFLFAVHKAAQIEKGKGNAVKLVSENPTLEELAMYEVADGKAYEDKGGSYESRMQFRYFNLIERMAKEAQSKIKALGKAYSDLEPSDPQRKAIMTSIKNLTDYQEKLFPSVDDIANYAEENQYFPKVKQATRFADVFGEYLYYDEMLKAVDKFYNYVQGDINIDGRSDIIERLALRKGQYEEAKKNAEEDSNKSKKEQKELFSGLNIDLGIDQGETTFEESEDGTLYVSPEGVVGKTLKQAGYDYREIDEDTDEDIAPREGVHGGFKRREVDRGFDIMAVLREIAATNPDAKELKERLKTLVPSRYETTFLTEFVRPEPNTRITYNHDGQDRTVEWRENEFGEGYWVGGTLGKNNKALTDKYTLGLINDAWMSQVDKEVLQSVGELDMVTAAELADFLFRGNSISDLSMIPSSKDSGIKNITSGDGKKMVSKQQDMTGGPGGGMLPFVFEAFIKEMYQRLNIKDFETEATVSEFIDPIKTKTAKVKVNDIDATLIVDENGMAAAYSTDSDGEAMRTIDVPKDEVEKLVQEQFGKDTKAVVEDLKKEDEPDAESQKPTEKAKAVGKKYKYIEDTKAEDFEKWKNDASTAVDHISESEDIDSSYSISRKEYSDYLKDLIDNGFGYETDKRNNDPMGTEAIKESDRWAETNKKSSTEKPKAEGQKPTEKAEGQRKYKKVKLKYSANKWFVDGKLVERSLFAEGAKHPEYDYMQAALAPIIQAVVDARRVDIFNTGKRNEKIVNPRDTSYDPNSEKGEDGAPEGSFDNQETETDTSKDGAKLDQKDLEQESKDGGEFKTLGDDENIPQAPSTKADAFASKLSGTDTNKRLYNLKKGRKQPIDLFTIVKLFKNDPVLWEAFDMPTPKNNVMDKKPFDSYIKDLKKHPNYKAFEARILSPGTEALGSSYSLSSGIPDNYGKLSILSRLASKAGVSEEDKEKYKKILSGFDFKTSLVDQADPPKQMVANFLKSVGIKDQALIDAIDVHGKWHQYYGKGYNTVEQSQIRFIEPIKDAMAKHGVTNSMLGEYLLARAAPSRNIHKREQYEAELKTMEEGSKEYKSLKKMLDERGDSLSGINTKDAIDRIKEMEAMDPIKNFILDENNPLQLFYDMNREALELKRDSGLIREEGDINEAKAMILAMSKYNINNISRARMNDNYNYAPMQGFEGETEKLFDNEMAYEAVGKSSTAAGRGWDQPKHTFLQKGAFGRTNTNIGPDPETVFAAAQDQYFDAAIRSHKNEVSNAFGMVYELMRAIAYPDDSTGLPNRELPDELKNLSPDVKKKVKAEFDQVFEKEFRELDTKKDYEIEEKDIEIDGQKVDGLKMVRRTLSTKFQNDPYVFVYRKEGVPHFIKFKGEPGARMAASLKNLRYESLPRILQLINKMTRFMAQMFTSMNPAFIIPNFIRDVGTAAIHLSEDDKKNMVGKTLSGKRLGKFMKAIFNVEQSLSKGENIRVDVDIDEDNAMMLLREGDHKKMYQFAKQAGAKIGMFRHKSMPELIEDARTNKAKNKKGVKARLKTAVQLVESMNTAVENSIRMSAFWSAIETGRTVHQAASISRNVTVDFNQKGNLTQAFGSLFVFFGASTNSAHRFARTLHKRGKVGSAKLIGGIVAASFVVALFNRLIDDDEDEEMPDYDTITSFKRDTNLLLPLPGNIPGLEDKTGRDTGYFGIPVPLGYNVFWALGQTTADFFAKYFMDRGGSGAMDFLTRNMDATMNAFNPIGGASLATALIPSAGKPIVEMYANKNFMGTEIRKSDVPYEAPKPAHMMDQKRTQELWTDFSRFINEALGGNDEIKGSIGGLFGGNPLLASDDSDYKFDLSGSEMEHLALGYLGGPGQIINMLIGDGLYPAIDDKEYNLDINKMPVVNRFIRTTTYGSATRRSYYKIREAAMIAKKAVEAAQKRGGVEFATMQKNQKPLIDIMPQIKAMDGKRSKLRDMKNKIENNKSFTKSQKMQRIEELERKELNMITAVIKKAQSLGIS